MWLLLFLDLEYLVDEIPDASGCNVPVGRNPFKWNFPRTHGLVTQLFFQGGDWLPKNRYLISSCISPKVIIYKMTFAAVYTGIVFVSANCIAYSTYTYNIQDRHTAKSR